jgi:hypothetical protein
MEQWNQPKCVPSKSTSVKELRVELFMLKYAYYASLHLSSRNFSKYQHMERYLKFLTAHQNNSYFSL